MEHCGRYRELNAFIYRDWWALRSRFEFDLKELCKGIPSPFGPPPDKPFPVVKSPAPWTTDRPAPTLTPEPFASDGEDPPGSSLTSGQPPSADA
jgi:hypothetical protein